MRSELAALVPADLEKVDRLQPRMHKKADTAHCPHRTLMMLAPVWVTTPAISMEYHRAPCTPAPSALSLGRGVAGAHHAAQARRRLPSPHQRS